MNKKERFFRSVLFCVLNLIQLKNLFEHRLGTRYGIHFHYHNVVHILVPFIDDGTFRLGLRSKIDSLFALIIAEKLVSDVPDGIVSDTCRLQHLDKFGPDFIVTAAIFLKTAVLYRGFPCILFHNFLLQNIITLIFFTVSLSMPCIRSGSYWYAP